MIINKEKCYSLTLKLQKISKKDKNYFNYAKNNNCHRNYSLTE